MHTLEQLRSGALKGTKRLKLSCALKEIPTEIFELADSLEILDLSGNELTTLPEELLKFKKLKIAFFSDNNFKVFPAVLGQFKHLEMIGFKANQIEHIPENALSPQLRWLILTNNKLRQLPSAIGACKRMQKLMLAGNLLSSLPVEMQACENIELLRISANAFTELPSWLLQLPKLSWLAFGGNLGSMKKSETHLAEIDWEELILEQKLGEGASGMIYEALWHHKNRKVAVKLFKGEITSDGLPLDEMLASKTAGTHKNLIKVLGTIKAHPKAQQGLVMEMLQSNFKNLGNPPSFESCTRDVYPPDTQFSEDQVFAILQGIASVAGHLHANGIIHGDLYAHNILINPFLETILGDFGAAWIYDKKDIPQSLALERIEVRAYGCLFEELLNYLTPNMGHEVVISKLQQLKEACMSQDLSLRPTFTDIAIQLSKIKNID